MFLGFLIKLIQSFAVAHIRYVNAMYYLRFSLVTALLNLLCKLLA